MDQIVTQIGEVREYAGYYVRAQMDRAKLSLRRWAVYAALAIMGLFASFALVFAIVWLLLLGLAQGLGAAFGDRVWLGNIAAALLTSITLAAIVWLILLRQKKRSYLDRVRRYRERQQEQKARFGHSVHEQAEQASD